MFATIVNYKLKYLKYKTKYIELKKKLNPKQFGAGNQWIYSDTKALVPNSYEIEKEYEKYVLDKKNNCNSQMNLIFISDIKAIYQGKSIEQIYKNELNIPNSSLSNVLSFLGPVDLSELQTVNRRFEKTAKPILAKYILSPINYSKLITKPIDEQKKYLNVIYDLRIPINANTLSRYLNSLKFINFEFNQQIQQGMLPDYLEILKFSSSFNNDMNPFDQNVLPKTLTELNLGSYDNELLPGILPDTLTNLYLGNSFNQELLPGVFPKNLKTLKMSTSFKHEILPNVLPDSLIILKFGFQFNQYLYPGVLPKGLVNLEFDDLFNQELSPGVLPICLVNLRFGRNFNKELSPWFFPECLKILILSDGSSLFKDKIIDLGILPKNLIELDLGNYEYKINQNSLPKTLEILTLGPNFYSELKEGFLPSNLKKLIFSRNYHTKLEPRVLPNSLTYLYLPEYDQKLEPGVLPQSLKTLILGGFNGDTPLEPNVLPLNLDKLEFIYNHLGPLESNVLPQNLTILNLEDYPYKLKQNVLPKSLKELIVNLNIEIKQGVLPDGVTLILGPNFNNNGEPFKKEFLPRNIKISINRSNHEFKDILRELNIEFEEYIRM